jgi:beta-phosphoglucomutase-like phosphatase (HAD superfamily)
MIYTADMMSAWRSLWLAGCLVGMAVPVFADCGQQEKAGTVMSNRAETVGSHVTQKERPHALSENRQAEGQEAARQAEDKVPGLEELVARLKASKAIGFFTKLAIRSDVLDLRAALEQHMKKNTFEAYRSDLRSRFDGLLLKIMALLEKDVELSREIYLARETIWNSLLEVKR